MGLYIDNPYTAKYSDNAGRLRFRCLPISINSKPSMEITGLLESRLILLRNVVCRLSTHDCCEEYCMLQVSPLARDWGITLKEDEKQHVLSLEEAEAGANKIIGMDEMEAFLRH
ncbi:hypothetical protein [Oryza sativa Japonica Group]|uniref:Uncharacterized protein n=1 Tax=Oryza sativa subsp. japonica TaxID=39947 RepID=Q657R6_ORYSJ|nr:hypothetical protein [Oryza sativa Japonica Group]